VAGQSRQKLLEIVNKRSSIKSESNRGGALPCGQQKSLKTRCRISPRTVSRGHISVILAYPSLSDLLQKLLPAYFYISSQKIFVNAKTNREKTGKIAFFYICNNSAKE
jgi:hypothetical protein